MKKKSKLFYNTFIGEMVSLMSNDKVEDSRHTEEGSFTTTHPLIYQGFLLDVDDEFYYLGEGDGSIDRAVARDVIVQIGIVSSKDEYEDILKNMDTPTSTEIN